MRPSKRTRAAAIAGPWLASAAIAAAALARENCGPERRGCPRELWGDSLPWSGRSPGPRGAPPCSRAEGAPSE